MIRTVETLVYSFDELSDDAKETARDWWRSCRDASGMDSVIEDFTSICALLGVTVDTHPVNLMNGKTRQEPSVSWSLGYSQSDFAAFDGSYRYAKGASKAIRQYAPMDKELHRIADELQAIQAKNFYKLCASIKYHHYYGQQVETEHCDDSWRDIGASADDLKELMRDLSSWLYDTLRKEDEYQSSDENVDEHIILNEYEFTEDGTIH